MKQISQEIFSLKQIGIPKHRDRKKYNQYFTPEFAVEKAFSFIPNSKIVKIVNIIDPAVGEGIFLKIAARKWAGAKLFGVDIDRIVIDNLKRSNIENGIFLCGDALLQKTWQNYELQKIILNGGFNLVVGNPPFSSWFQRITKPNVLSNYELAYKKGKLIRSQAIEILFLERFINLCKDNGFIIIVLPDGILSNPQYKYVRRSILQKTEIKHILDLPRNVFKDTSAKTSILVLQKKRKTILDYQVNLSNLEKTGCINNTIEVRATHLINRMDYYYHSLNKNRINELINNGLEFKPLKNFLVYCKTGKTLYGENRKFSQKGLKFLHATNITDIGINYKKDEKFIDPLSKMNFLNAHVKIGNITFVRVGVGCAGRIAIIDTKKDEGVATDYIHILKVRDINPYFLVVYLKTQYGKASIEILKHGVGTVSINKSDVYSIPTPIIPKEIQNSIKIRYKNILKRWRPAVYRGQNHIVSDCENKMRVLITDLEKILKEYRHARQN